MTKSSINEITMYTCQRCKMEIILCDRCGESIQKIYELFSEDIYCNNKKHYCEECLEVFPEILGHINNDGDTLAGLISKKLCEHPGLIIAFVEEVEK